MQGYAIAKSINKAPNVRLDYLLDRLKVNAPEFGAGLEQSLKLNHSRAKLPFAHPNLQPAMHRFVRL